MNRKELIEKLKNNDKGFMFLYSEEQKILKELVKIDKVQCVIAKTWETKKEGIFFNGTVYRICPDYTETEIIECEVKERGRYSVLESKCNGVVFTMSGAMDSPQFRGYKFSNGIISNNPWIFSGTKCELEHATHVLMLCGK